MYKGYYHLHTYRGLSFQYIEKYHLKKGSRIDPCGTPAIILYHSLNEFSILQR